MNWPLDSHADVEFDGQYTITYQQGFTGEPSTFFEGEMDLSLADDVVGLIDDMENGLYLPDNITDVEAVNSMPDDPDEARRG